MLLASMGVLTATFVMILLLSSTSAADAAYQKERADGNDLSLKPVEWDFVGKGGDKLPKSAPLTINAHKLEPIELTNGPARSPKTLQPEPESDATPDKATAPTTRGHHFTSYFDITATAFDVTDDDAKVFQQAVEACMNIYNEMPQVKEDPDAPTMEGIKVEVITPVDGRVRRRRNLNSRTRRTSDLSVAASGRSNSRGTRGFFRSSRGGTGNSRMLGMEEEEEGFDANRRLERLTSKVLLNACNKYFLDGNVPGIEIFSSLREFSS